MIRFNLLFLDESTKAMAYLILGIRGSGKTVFSRSIANEIKLRENWVVIDLNPQGDFISSMAESLYLEAKKNRLGFDWSIDLSLPYVSFHAKKDTERFSSETAIRKLIPAFSKRKKRILLTIDEANPTDKMKYFANFYQSLIGEGNPLFLLMTGLIDNVDSLMNNKATSFLSRTPKLYLEPLDLLSISKSYQKELKASPLEASELAKLTRGYAFAYQVLGKICFEEQSQMITPSILQKSDAYLAENGYGVIWKSMSDREKSICIAIADSKSLEVSKIRETSGISEKNFANYRMQMIRKGYLVATKYGQIDFALPRFKEYVQQVRYFL